MAFAVRPHGREVSVQPRCRVRHRCVDYGEVGNRGIEHIPKNGTTAAWEYGVYKVREVMRFKDWDLKIQPRVKNQC